MTQHRFEVMRLSAVWDTPREDRESIPTLLEFIRDPDVITELEKRYAAQWMVEPDWSLFLGDDHALADEEFARRFVMESEERFGRAEAAKCRRRLELAIIASDRLRNSTLFKVLMDFRDMRIAHNLGPSAAKVSNEEKTKSDVDFYIFERTLKILDCLNIGIRGASFDWGRSREIAERYAKAFWGGVTINVRE